MAKEAPSNPGDGVSQPIVLPVRPTMASTQNGLQPNLWWNTAPDPAENSSLWWNRPPANTNRVRKPSLSSVLAAALPKQGE